MLKEARGFTGLRGWQAVGCIDAIFSGSVRRLHDAQLLDLTVIHSDDTTTAAKKGGDNLGYSGHKHLKGDRVVALCDRHCNVIAPFVTAAGNRNESLLPLSRWLKPEQAGEQLPFNMPAPACPNVTSGVTTLAVPRQPQHAHRNPRNDAGSHATGVGIVYDHDYGERRAVQIVKLTNIDRHFDRVRPT